MAEAALPPVGVEEKRGELDFGTLCDCWSHHDDSTTHKSMSERIRKICSDLKKTIFFWIVYLAFTLVEPILCSHFPKVFLPIFY